MGLAGIIITGSEVRVSIVTLTTYRRYHCIFLVFPVVHAFLFLALWQRAYRGRAYFLLVQPVQLEQSLRKKQNLKLSLAISNLAKWKSFKIFVSSKSFFRLYSTVLIFMSKAIAISSSDFSELSVR